ncbi:MAG: NAD(P)-binding protein [Bacteroidota bacterium]|nr:NAD(P)-binding protein [Bacteroidota bacterium]
MAVIRITLPYNHNENDLARAVANRFGRGTPYRILRRSLDARQRNIVVEYHLTTDISDPADRITDGIRKQNMRLDRHFRNTPRPRPIVVGSGPAGLFCAYWLSIHGFRPLLLEQGPPLAIRLRDIARFIKTGALDPFSNICFGAGGAGTYSDGKLTTRIRSPFIPFIAATLVRHGAPEEIRYLSEPHLGSNGIRRCIARFLATLETQGVDIRYSSRICDFESRRDGMTLRVSRACAGASAASNEEEISISGATLFLACGHSARETYRLLRKRGVRMEAKEFAVGIRIEHPARAVDEMRYGADYRSRYPGIEHARYRFAQTWKDEGRAVYTFCMCPGGHVVNAASGDDGVVTNGMSNARRAGRFSNAAVVVNVSHYDLEHGGYEGPDGGCTLQCEVEERCRAAVNHPGSAFVVPAQKLEDFLEGRRSSSIDRSSCLNPIAPASLHEHLPSFVTDAIRRGMVLFDRKMPGFATHPEAKVFGPETRTSSPYRVVRHPVHLVSVSHPDLYPMGEGAGYAGGIVSSAVDGIRCAQAFIERFIESERFDSATVRHRSSDEPVD